MGGSGRSSNRHTTVEQTCHIGAELRIVKRDRTHHHQVSRRGLLFQLTLDEAGVIAAIGRVCVDDDEVQFVHGDSGNRTQGDQFRLK